MRGIFESKEIEIEAFTTDALKTYAPMFHSHGEILYVTEGTVTVTVDGRRKELLSDELCVVFPYCVHSYEPQTGAEVSVVLFSLENVGEFSEVLLSSVPHNPFFENSSYMYPLMKKILSLSKESNSLCRKTRDAYLKALLGELLINMELSDRNTSDANVVRAVLEYCSEHFMENISIKSVAGNIFVSERYITKIFAEKVGCSFRNYINALRINRAKQLINETTLGITDIMYECGVRNQSTFNRVFLEEVGVSPRIYRKSISQR